MSFYKLMVRVGVLDLQIYMPQEMEKVGLNAGEKNMKWNSSGLW